LAFITNIPNSINSPIETTRDNVDMTIYLLNLCLKAKIKKFLFPSTASLYGNNVTPWNEEMLPDPMEPYSFQKISCEYACKVWYKCFGLKTTIFRFFQVYGENQRKDTAISKFIQSKKEGKPITLIETTAQSSFKTGRRDFIYVKDLAEAVIIAVQSEKTGTGEILNIGTGKATTVEDVANAVGGEIIFLPKRKFEVETHLADMNKTYKLLNWKYKTEVLEWVRNFSKKF
jgi:nucleoside-diphosphate-sugar epimerase